MLINGRISRWIGGRLGLLWLALAGLAVSPWAIAPPSNIAPSQLPMTAASVQELVKAVPPLADLTQTATRPLFAPSRRPTAAPTPQVAASPAPANPTRLVGYRLTGIVRSSVKRMILLTEEKSGRVVELHEGEQVDGWRLTAVGTDHVRLTRDGREIDLLNPKADKATLNGRNTHWLPSVGERR